MTHVQVSGDVGKLAAVLNKPLRPIWLSQESRMWLNEMADHVDLPFTPLYLVSASKPQPQRQSIGEPLLHVLVLRWLLCPTSNRLLYAATVICNKSGCHVIKAADTLLHFNGCKHDLALLDCILELISSMPLHCLHACKGKCHSSTKAAFLEAKLYS